VRSRYIREDSRKEEKRRRRRIKEKEKRGNGIQYCRSKYSR
jgi:hypothetical protein